MTACADISPEMAALRAGEYGIRALGSMRSLADPAVDLVLNLTIPAAHFDVTHVRALAGKHVFTEKPLATSAEAGRRLVAEARARGLSLVRRPTPSSGRPGGGRGG